MPNWCENILIIEPHANPEEQNLVDEEIVDYLEGPYQPPFYIPEKERDFYKVSNTLDETGHLKPGHSLLSFHKILPISYKVLEAKNPEFDFGPIGIQEEPSHRWGTKWQPSNIDRYEDSGSLTPDSIKYVFSTAWGPSLPVSQEISRLFPSARVLHYYLEFGCMFGGYQVFEKGELVHEEIIPDNQADLRRFAIEHMEYDEDTFDDWDD